MHACRSTLEDPTLGFLLVAMPSGTIFVNISAFVQNQGYNAGFGAFVVAIYGVGVLLGRPVWGVFLPRVGIYGTMIAFAAIYCASIAIFAIQPGHSVTALGRPWVSIDLNLGLFRILGVFTGVQLLLLFWTAWLGVAVSGSQLLQAQALPDYFGRAIVGRLTSVSQLANVMISAGAPLLAAFVFDATGSYVPVFLFFSGACAVAAVAFYLSSPPVHPSERGGVREPESLPSSGEMPRPATA